MKKVRQKNKQESQPSISLKTDVFSLRARWIILCLVLLLVALVRVRLLDIPLERDEGEYAYMGQMLLDGIPPYSAAYNMKFPGTYLTYALILSVFGETTRGIHLGLLAVNCVTVLLVFFLCKRLVNDLAALIASGAYAILSVSPSVLGFAAHATHFVALWAVAGSLVLLSAVEKNKLYLFFLSGTMFGLAFLMKQPGVFFTVFGASYLVYHYWSSKTGLLFKTAALNLAVFLSGALLPLLAALIWLYTAGVFDKFWFWTIQYAAKYGAQVPLSEVFAYFKLGVGTVVDGFWLLWIISGLGLLIVVFDRALKDSRVFIILFSIFSFLSIFPGFYFREHYFITLLPAVSILIGVFFNYLNTRSIAFFKAPRLRYTGIVAFVAIALVGVNNHIPYFLQDSPADISDKIYGDNPFDESIEIARFIKARSAPDDKIAVFGSEPQIYFYADRISATGYIYTYGLMEIHSYSLTMQKEMIREMEVSKPKFIVDVHVATSWLVQPESDNYIFGWLGEFLKNGYTLVGVVDINTHEATVYKWHGEIKNYTIQLPSYVLIYERL